MSINNLPEKLSLKEFELTIDEFSIRQPKYNEDFFNTLPFAMEFGFAESDGQDHLARLRINLGIESESDELPNPMSAIFFSTVAVFNSKTDEPVGLFISENLPDIIKATFLGISIDTIRGMLKVRMAGFDLASAQIPIFNPVELVSKMTQKNNEENNE